MDASAWIALALTALGMVGGLLGVAVNFGTETQKLRSANDLLATQLGNAKETLTAANENLRERLESLALDGASEKAHNAKQHEEFYKYKDMTIRLEQDIGYIKVSIGEIKDLIVAQGERRQGVRKVGQ